MPFTAVKLGAVQGVIMVAVVGSWSVVCTEY